MYHMINIYTKCFKRETLVRKPHGKEKERMINDILRNKELFKGNILNDKKHMIWLDAVLVEDIRKLIYKNQLTRENLEKILS